MVNARQIQPRPRIKNPRVARGATETRVRHHSRARYSTIVRFSLILGLAVVLLIGYVTLTANLTGMTYAVSQAQEQRTQLQEQTARLDDRLMQMESQNRLAGIAARLGMHEPQTFAVVRVPAMRPETNSRLAFLARLGIR
jgi:hypothetical protein